MNVQFFEQAKQYAFRRLERELPPRLYYHRSAHTYDEVVPAAEILAGMEGIRGEALYLLLTAAWFHDLGHVEQTPEHELIGARIAAQVLPDFGYAKEQIEIIRRAILATALPQSPATLLEQVLADADLSVLGHENFMTRNNDLRRELASFGKQYGDIEWYRDQIVFFEEHQYFTESARALRNARKLLNLAAIMRKLKTLGG
jgi:uncharacterized protein